MRSPMAEARRLRGETEDHIPCSRVVTDADCDDDVETLRYIRAASVEIEDTETLIRETLRIVERKRDSDHDIKVSTDPESVGARRSEIPAAKPIEPEAL